jgi:phospholipid-binding lipoprotein MlaA
VHLKLTSPGHWTLIPSIILLVVLVTPVYGMIPQPSTEKPLEDPFAETPRYESTLADPLEPVNRVFFTVNTAYYYYGIRPLTDGYRSVTNDWTRRRVRLFFLNLGEPISIFNSILQRKPGDALTSTKRFFVNSIFGLGGLFDPASRHHERVIRGFDQTFAKWGIDHGFYIHWPIVGPSSPRYTGSMILGEAMNPFWWSGSFRVTAGALSLETVSWSAERGGRYGQILTRSVDGYTAMKNIFEQTTSDRARQ